MRTLGTRKKRRHERVYVHISSKPAIVFAEIPVKLRIVFDCMEKIIQTQKSPQINYNRHGYIVSIYIFRKIPAKYSVTFQ